MTSHHFIPHVSISAVIWVGCSKKFTAVCYTNEMYIAVTAISSVLHATVTFFCTPSSKTNSFSVLEVTQFIRFRRCKLHGFPENLLLSHRFIPGFNLYFLVYFQKTHMHYHEVHCTANQNAQFTDAITTVPDTEKYPISCKHKSWLTPWSQSSHQCQRTQSSTAWRNSWVAMQSIQKSHQTLGSSTRTPTAAVHLAAQNLRWHQYQRTSAVTHCNHCKNCIYCNV